MFEVIKRELGRFTMTAFRILRSILLQLLACFVLLSANTLNAASFQIVDAPYAGKGIHAKMPNIKAVVLEGAIEIGDSEVLARLLADAAKGNLDVRQIYLRSPGGVLAEGFEIGKIIRQSGLIAIAPDLWMEDIPYCVMPFLVKNTRYPDDPNCICGSACAIAWFGGVFRWGNVALHRSYISRNAPDINFRMTEDLLSESYNQISNYLKSMRVPESIIDKVLSTPSSRTSYLSDDEVSRMRIDRVFEEYLISSCGNNPFMPRDTYLLFDLGLKADDANVQLDTNESAALKFMRYADAIYARCFEETHRSIIELGN